MWGVSLRKGHHLALISFETYQRLQTVLNGKLYAPAVKDICEDFPLRGFVACADCDKPMTSWWSKGRKKHYVYNLCDMLTSPSKRKSMPRAKIEEGAEALRRNLTTAGQVVELAKAIWGNALCRRPERAQGASEQISRGGRLD